MKPSVSFNETNGFKRGHKVGTISFVIKATIETFLANLDKDAITF